MSDPTSQSPSTKDLAKERAAGVSSTAKDSAQQVAGTATQQAGQVASEVSSQARNLVGEATTAAQMQVNDQRDKAVGGLRSLGSELSGMADKSDEGGLAADLARQVADRVHQVADFLDGREPADLLEDVRALARRKPGTFLIGAALAGVLAGRVTRGAVSAAKSDDSADTTTTGYQPAVSTGYDATTGTGFDAGYAPGTTAAGVDAGFDVEGAPSAYTTQVEPGPYETTHGIDATGEREPSTGPLSGGGYAGRP
jgi:hypothetical protein